MARALKICATCTYLTAGTYCQQCAPPAWHGSTRNNNTTSGWAQQRRAKRILRQSDTCHICGLPGADTVDHVIPLAHGGTDTDDNLKPIHKIPCHQRKTQAEAAQTRRNTNRKDRA